MQKFKNFEILNDDKDIPKVNLDGVDFNVHISLSHSNDKALAFAVIIKDE